ncbi:MAG: DUF58 domain-containing protein [Actinobacteria bacterium]|nr:DUF58 domain-containing protein [Actinomycetota bacterium]
MGLVPGHGSEQGESRTYQPGDDVRRIDWNVTARMIEPHVRETIADRELETWVVLDLAPSLSFGTALCEKRDLAISAAAAAGFLTHRTGNRFGLLVLTPGGAATFPARGGKDHLLAAMHHLVTSPRFESGRTDLVSGLGRIGAIARRRGFVVVVSDFLADPATWEHPLARLSTRHEVLCVDVADPRELELPPVGVLQLVDPGSGELLEVQSSNARVRARYAEAAAAQRAAIAAAIVRSGAGHLRLRTDRDWLLDLVHFVAARRDRIRGLTRSRPT